MNKKNLLLLETGGYKYIIGARIKSESDERARKDRYNRDKGVKRLKTAYKSGTITKENINKRGYNKFLEFQRMLV